MVKVSGCEPGRGSAGSDYAQKWEAKLRCGSQRYSYFEGRDRRGFSSLSNDELLEHLGCASGLCYLEWQVEHSVYCPQSSSGWVCLPGRDYAAPCGQETEAGTDRFDRFC